MGAGYQRRYTSFPALEELTKIEGSVIVDLPPPASISGVGTGVVGLIGEFADMSYGVKLNPTTNLFETSPQPVEIFSAADLALKMGGFDSTLGEFGDSFGNGFSMIRNRAFARLVAVPVNLASARPIRFCRELPTNASATNASPVVPMAAATVPAGYLLKSSGGGRVKSAAAVSFTSDDAIQTGTDGTTLAVAGSSFTFTSATATFVTNGVQEGDAVVIGVIGGAGAQGSFADTYRVVSVTSETALVLEKQDTSGGSFTPPAFATFAYRVHPGATADTGGHHQSSEEAGYTIPARPLLNSTGGAVDGTYAASTVLTPVTAPASATATTWDILSGLFAQVSPGGTLAYDASLQAANVASSAELEALYLAALESTITEETPAHDINLVLVCRLGANYRTMLKQHLLTASAEGQGRTAQVSPTLSTVSRSTVLGNSGEGVGAVRNQRLDYTWPSVTTLIPEAIGLTIDCADGTTTTDGVLDVPAAGYLTALLSNLPPERNPGELSTITQTVWSSCLGLQRGVSGLRMSDYVQFKAKGVAAPRKDPDSGFVLQSGVTSSITDGERNINRQRMSDFIGDSIGRRFNLYAKLPMTEDLKDTIESEATSFLDNLLSVNNPSLQRISAYQVDRKSGNLPELEARGVFVVIIRVRTLATMDEIVLQNEIGEGVVIVTEL